jgi:DNA-nicking Smr family endonuclease
MTRRLSETEKQTWTRVARTVKPMRGKRLPVADEEPGPETKASVALAPAKAPPKPKAPRKPGPPADVSTQKRVRRGQAEVEARLDLHGHTQDTAYRELAGFLMFHHAQGARCVLVITGKGRLGKGVLRDRLQDWISGPDLRAIVSGYSAAHMRHGGEGAFYLMLRRRPD